MAVAPPPRATPLPARHETTQPCSRRCAPHHQHHHVAPTSLRVRPHLHRAAAKGPGLVHRCRPHGERPQGTGNNFYGGHSTEAAVKVQSWEKRGHREKAQPEPGRAVWQPQGPQPGPVARRAVGHCGTPPRSMVREHTRGWCLH